MSKDLDNTELKPICVVLDTNIWVREHLLRSALGAALIYGLSRIGGVIGLPEVTELEVLRKITEMGQEAVKSIIKNFSTVQAIVGDIPELEFPSDSDFENQAVSRIRDLRDLIKRVDLTFEQCRSALRRVIEHRTPNAKKEQFRDTLVWEAAFELSRSYRVRLITNDTDFCKDGKYQSGLAEDLVQECRNNETEVVFYSDLQSYLRTLEESIPPPDYAQIAIAIDDAIGGDLSDYASLHDIGVGDLLGYNIDAFLTEKISSLALSFELTYKAFDVQQMGGTIIPEAKLVVLGDCLFDIESGNISETRLNKIDCIGPNGEKITGKGMGFLYDTITLGWLCTNSP